MTGTGNDIISLKAINSTRTKQPRFYSKVLSASEQALYNEPELAVIPFENFVWLLWSVKESAFKYLQRINPDLIFSPTKFIVQHLELPFEYAESESAATETEGVDFDTKAVVKSIIKVGNETLYARSIIHKEFIVSVVNAEEDFKRIYWGIKLINKSDYIHQSRAVREFLVIRLHRLFPTDNLLIGKNENGYPIALKGSEERSISVSLTHHDRLVAYSFQYAF